MLPDSRGMGGFLPHSFPGLTAMILGANWLAGLPQDGDFEEYSQAAAKTPFAFGEVPCLLRPDKDCLFIFSVGGKKPYVGSFV